MTHEWIKVIYCLEMLDRMTKKITTKIIDILVNRNNRVANNFMNVYAIEWAQANEIGSTNNSHSIVSAGKDDSRTAVILWRTSSREGLLTEDGWLTT